MFSCRSDTEIFFDGYWRLDLDSQNENPSFPFELKFIGDNLFMIDGYNFTHDVKYKDLKDTLNIIFSNGYTCRKGTTLYSDSLLFFDNEEFFRVSSDYFSEIHTYQLLGFETNKTLDDSSYDSVIHLIKKDDQAKVLLNDAISEFKDIPDFLCGEYRKPPTLLLYIGKGISFKDLIGAYFWILTSQYQKVTLVLANRGYEAFFIQKDYFRIEDSLMNEFRKINNLPPFPQLSSELIVRPKNVITIENSNHISKLESLSDSIDFVVAVDTDLDLISYLKVNEILQEKRNIKKVIKRLTTK